MPPPSTPPPDELRAQLQWAASVVGRYGGPGTHAAGEPVFAQLTELTVALSWACTEGTAEDLMTALAVADVLGAAWERLGEHQTGRERLSDVLTSAARIGLPFDAAVARVLRRRARLAMRAGLDAEAHEDLQRAYEIASAHDDPITISVMLDRADLSMHRGDWATAAAIVPELLLRTGATGDPLLQAMGLNRSGWAAFGSGDLSLSKQRYEAAQNLAELHEDPVVEARTASGLGVTAMLSGSADEARGHLQRSLELAEQVHDRGFVLHSLDGIAAMLAISGREADALRLLNSVSEARETLGHPREAAVEDLANLVLQRAASAEVEPEVWPYGEALSFGRQAVAYPAADPT